MSPNLRWTSYRARGCATWDSGLRLRRSTGSRAKHIRCQPIHWTLRRSILAQRAHAGDLRDTVYGTSSKLSVWDDLERLSPAKEESQHSPFTSLEMQIGQMDYRAKFSRMETSLLYDDHNDVIYSEGAKGRKDEMAEGWDPNIEWQCSSPIHSSRL